MSVETKIVVCQGLPKIPRRVFNGAVFTTFNQTVKPFAQIGNDRDAFTSFVYSPPSHKMNQFACSAVCRVQESPFMSS